MMWKFKFFGNYKHILIIGGQNLLFNWGLYWFILRNLKPN